MFCENCGTKMNENAKICPSCGGNIELNSAQIISNEGENFENTTVSTPHQTPVYNLKNQYQNIPQYPVRQPYATTRLNINKKTIIIIASVVGAVILIALILILTLNKPTNKAILGKWQDISHNGETIEFFDNGSVTYDGISGTYTISEDTITMERTLIRPIPYRYKIKGDTLIMSETSNGFTVTFKKVKNRY